MNKADHQGLVHGMSITSSTTLYTAALAGSERLERMGQGGGSARRQDAYHVIFQGEDERATSNDGCRTGHSRGHHRALQAGRSGG